jgi:hypothetical protein
VTDETTAHRRHQRQRSRWKLSSLTHLLLMMRRCQGIVSVNAESYLLSGLAKTLIHIIAMQFLLFVEWKTQTRIHLFWKQAGKVAKRVFQERVLMTICSESLPSVR